MSKDLKELIADKRPALGKSSITTYASVLKNLHKRIFGGEIKVSDFDETDRVLDFLKDVPPNKRKTILSSLVVITDKKPYRDQMLEDVRDYNADIQKQTKTDTQRESWIGGDDVRAVYADLKKNADLLYKKKGLTPADYQQIQNFIIVSLLGGVFVPPRRSKDFVDFKISGIEKSTDNFLEKNKMIFNSYKTAKTYGRQELDIPVQLKNILAKWIKINPTEHLLFDVNGNKLSSVKLNQRLNRIFGEGRGVNQMRHTYLTDKYKKTSEESKALANTMTAMGSSSNMADTYIKLK